MRENSSLDPKVSVIMPTYNGAHFLQDALFSVLQQDYQNMEIIICDDASKDNTRELIEEIKQYHDYKDQIQLIRQSHNQGISKNMNTGLEAANGKYIAILDQDDVWLDTQKINKQVYFLEENNEYKIVGTNAVFDIYGSQEKRIYPKTDNQIRKVILGTCPMLHSSVMYDRELAKRVGGYTESYKYAMDYKLFLDFMYHGKGANLNEETTYYRRHGNNTSILKSKEQHNEAIQIRRDHKNNFPNWSKNMILYKTIHALNNLFGDNPEYIKIKQELKKIYLHMQNT